MKNLLIFISLLFFLSCQSSLDQNIATDVETRMQKFIAEKKISGAVTIAIHDGIIIHHQATGYANIEKKQKMTNQSLFRIASLTKNITSIGIMILQDRGMLIVDDKVSKYIPSYDSIKVKGSSEPVDLRIWHLMSHTSGINVPRVDRINSLEELAEIAAKQPLDFVPGSQWKYSRGLDVCARIIEIISGMNYADFLKKEIFEPLGMENTTFYPSEEQGKRLVITYQPSENGEDIVPSTNESLITPPRGLFTPSPSGGLISSAQDMARFYQMLLNGGELEGTTIISESSSKQIRESKTGENKAGFVPGSAWGLGFGIVKQPTGVSSMLSLGTFGHGGAYGTQGWADPVTNTVYVLMIQRTKFGNSDASEIRKEFQQAIADGIK